MLIDKENRNLDSRGDYPMARWRSLRTAVNDATKSGEGPMQLFTLTQHTYEFLHYDFPVSGLLVVVVGRPPYFLNPGPTSC